jgi:hypothetical protein
MMNFKDVVEYERVCLLEAKYSSFGGLSHQKRCQLKGSEDAKLTFLIGLHAHEGIL